MEVEVDDGANVPGKLGRFHGDVQNLILISFFATYEVVMPIEPYVKFQNND